MITKSRDSFIFYRSFYESLVGMDKTSQADCLMAMADYALNGTEPTLSPEVRLFFTLVKPQIDANNQRFSNGCKGGRPKNKNQNKTKKKPNDNQKETKAEPNDNVNVNDNGNVKKEKDNTEKEKTIHLGELGNVKLTQEQYDQLKDKYYDNALNGAIEKLDTWLATTGVKHNNKNHYGYFKSNSWVWENLPANKTSTLDQEKAKQEQEQWERADLLHQQSSALYEKLRAMNMKVIFADEFRQRLASLLDKYQQKYNKTATYDDMANDIGLDKLKTLIERGVK